MVGIFDRLKFQFTGNTVRSKIHATHT